MKKKQKFKRLDISESSVSKQRAMVEIINNNNNNNGGTPCHNSPRCLSLLTRTQRNVRKSKIKIDLLLIMYANPFVGLHHEDSYTHLIKFYEIWHTRSSKKWGRSGIPNIVSILSNWQSKRVVSRLTHINDDKLELVGGIILK